MTLILETDPLPRTTGCTTPDVHSGFPHMSLFIDVIVAETESVIVSPTAARKMNLTNAIFIDFLLFCNRAILAMRQVLSLMGRESRVELVKKLWNCYVIG